MLAQIRIMARLELCNLLGINILRFTKDKRKKKRAVMLSVLWILLIFMWAAFPGDWWRLEQEKMFRLMSSPYPACSFLYLES